MLPVYDYAYCVLVVKSVGHEEGVRVTQVIRMKHTSWSGCPRDSGSWSWLLTAGRRTLREHRGTREINIDLFLVAVQVDCLHMQLLLLQPLIRDHLPKFLHPTLEAAADGRARSKRVPEAH